jgi:IS5 family transposase
VSHGACVGVGCVSMVAAYEWLMHQDMRRIDPVRLAARVPSPAAVQAEIDASFPLAFMAANALTEAEAKAATPQAETPGTAAPETAAPADPFAAGKRSRVDPDARWGKKGQKAFFGYKLHLAVDQQPRVVRAHRVTAATVNDCEVGPQLVQPDGGPHYGDKGYPSAPLRQELARHRLADGIMQLGSKHHPLRPAERRRNRALAGVRYAVEGVFGEMKRRPGLARARYFGLDKVKLECDLVVFGFNLKTLALAAKTS